MSSELTREQYEQVEALAEDIATAFIEDLNCTSKENAEAVLKELKLVLKRELDGSIVDEVMLEDEY